MGEVYWGWKIVCSSDESACKKYSLRWGRDQCTALESRHGWNGMGFVAQLYTPACV